MTWFKNDKEEKRYKLKSLNTFAWDRTISNLKKFRKVFDRHEINYLSVSLQFYNKLFDEKDWKTTVIFKAFVLDGDKKGEEICASTKEYVVSKDKNVLMYEYGWGNDEYGKFWSKGDYVWEVYIDDVLVGSTNFRIENVGRVSNTKNPYFEIVSLKTYESPKGDVKEADRVYLKQYNKDKSRYVMAELKFQSKLDFNWECELFFNFYDDTGLLVGVADIYHIVTPDKSDDEVSIITAGWGNADGDIWIHDNYRIEVVFMDTVVAMIPFKVGDKQIERLSEFEALLNEEVSHFYEPGDLSNLVDSKAKPVFKDIEDTKEEEKKENPVKKEEKIDNRPLEEVLKELDELIGLKNIKNKIREYVDYVSYLQFRKEKGIEGDDEINLHSVFTGNPGTGKTTVVKLLGSIYRAMGILSKGHVLTVESNDLIAGYVRQTGENTKKIIEEARGGILFIDEAYMLYKDGAPNDFGPEAIAALITEMSDGPGDIAIMVAGYPKEMEGFINSNPGLKSRFRNHYHFNDYTPIELVNISKFAAKKKDVVLSEKALVKLKKIVTNAYRKRDQTFGNARLVYSMVDEAKMNLGIRLIREHNPENFTKEMLLSIKERDIEDLSEKGISERLKLDVDTALLDEALGELNALTGLEKIKQEVQELIRLTRYYRELDRDILKAFSMHSVFLGNPGTGKTTVARIIGKVYKSLGLLERGHVVEADGGDLIAGFIGQTSIKTKEIIKKAMGGILFIDEAYAITESSAKSGANDFGKKAIASLIKEMEDHRGEFGLIVAGYTDNMKRFLETNPGMKSRFDRTFHFLDFTEKELWEIAVNMFKKRGLKTDKAASKHIKTYIGYLYQNRSKFFGNARSIRKMVEKTNRNQELRMANLKKAERTEKMMETIVLDDVKEFDVNAVETSGRKSVGFR